MWQLISSAATAHSSISSSDMRHAKLFSTIVFIAVLGYGAVGFYFLPMANFQGDLTRMGMLPETQFGWRKPQPAVKQQWLTQASMQEADVLVIGDRFSDSRVWQSALTQHGLKVRTEHWDTMRGICADFMPWLREQGFQGGFVVLQIIERNITGGLEKSVACQRMQIHPSVYADKPRYPPAVSFDPDRKDRSGRFSIGIQTALNYRDYARLSNAPDFKFATLPNGAKIARVKNGCDLFSHTRCNEALFLGEDKAGDVDGSALDNIEKLHARLNGITPIWMFVPNKSTAYLYPDKQFWNEAERRFHIPNLLRITQQALQEKTVDLYPANNTHFSTTGYLLMGEEIFKAMQQAQAQAQAQKHTR